MKRPTTPWLTFKRWLRRKRGANYRYSEFARVLLKSRAYGAPYTESKFTGTFAGNRAEAELQ